MRHALTLLHRYAGLLTAAFLLLTGVTGAVISWDHELDEWLNPHLTQARAAGSGRDPLALAAEIEARYPQAQVTFIPLAAEPGHSLAFGVEPRVDAQTGRLHEIGFNQVFVDPATGAELGRREWGAVWPITKETFVSFLFKLHYSLHLPEMWGTDRWGLWLLGVVAVVWTLDCFVGFYLTLPSRRRKKATSAHSDDALAQDRTTGATEAATPKSYWQRWQPSWRLRTRAGAYKLNFDLHRAASLWTWSLLFVLAFTAFSLALYREVFYPIMSLVSQVSPSVWHERKPADKHLPITPTIDYRRAIALASDEARQRGWEAPAGSVYYSREFGIYGVSFYRPAEDHGVGGVGHRAIEIDGRDARLVGDFVPWEGTAADIFLQAQLPLHSGRILGLPGRILISVMGIVVAMLSVTGVYIWWKKRKARLKAASREPARPSQLGGSLAAK